MQASSYTLLLHSVDGVNDSDLMSPYPVTVMSLNDDDFVVLNVLLPWRRIWEYQVLPYGIECFTSISEVFQISKSLLMPLYTS